MRRRSQNKPKSRLILGITGGFGSGKTIVAKMFGSLGALVLDADRIAHECLKPSNPAYGAILAAFGEGLVRNNETIDRKKLGALVFNNKKLLLKLDKIIHPQVIRVLKKKIKDSKSKIIVLDVPLLIESGLKKEVDKLIVVKCGLQKQIKRIKLRDRISTNDILKRMRLQMPQKQKLMSADFIIDNSRTLKETERQVRRLWRSLASG